MDTSSTRTALSEIIREWMVAKKRMNCPVCRMGYKMDLGFLWGGGEKRGVMRRLERTRLDERGSEFMQLVLNYIRYF